jgi:CubicO group peptidase (beta-lactamase class C family)
MSPLPELGQSFGLGFAVRTDVGHTAVSGLWAKRSGRAPGTCFWIDPQEKLYAVMML